MPIILGLSLVLQVFCAIHAVRSGKDSFWLWIIIIAPGLGSFVYLVTQVLPELGGSRTVHRARRSLVNTVDPKRELRKRTVELEVSNTVQNRMALADECMEAGMFDDAAELLEEAMTGLHKTDPGLMERYASASFGQGNAQRAKNTLDELIAANPDYRSPEAHLLYARSLEGMGDLDAAREEYEALHESYPGEEGRVRYALLLQKTGDVDRARQMFAESLKRSRHAPAHYRKAQRDWLKIAEREVG